MLTDPDPDVQALLSAGRNAEARKERLGELLFQYRARLLRVVELRMDPVLRARLGASDVVQDAYVEIARRVDRYLKAPTMPFFLWARFITVQRILKAHRFHVSAQQRDTVYGQNPHFSCPYGVRCALL